MNLSVFERLMLFHILPREGDFVTLKTVRKLREALSLSEDEQKEINFQAGNEQGAFTWDKQVDKEIAIGEKALDIIASRLKELNKQKKLKMEHFALYERFIGDE